MDQITETARRVTGLLELDAGLEIGALTKPGRGTRGQIFGRYLAAYILVERFRVPIERVAHALKRDRGTVTQAMKVFRFLEGYPAWRDALESISDLSFDFVEYGERRALAAANIPAPVGREGRNDNLPAWVREQYAREVEAVGEESVAQARMDEAVDTLLANHPAVKVITDDPDVKQLLGKPVVSVSLSPLDDPSKSSAPILLVPPTPPTVEGRITLRLLCKGDSPSEIETMRTARASIGRALAKSGMRLSGAAETFPARDRLGWRYIPLYIARA